MELSRLQVPSNLKKYFKTLDDKATNLVQLPGEWKTSVWYWILYQLSIYDRTQTFRITVQPESMNDMFFKVRMLFRYGVDVLLGPYLAHAIENLGTGLSSPEYKPTLGCNYKETINIKLATIMNTVRETLRRESNGIEELFRHMIALTQQYGPFIALSDRHALYITTTGLFGSGTNYNKQLGYVNTSYSVWPPQWMKTPPSLVACYCARGKSALLTREGLYAWGDNTFGAIGLPQLQEYAVPTMVPLQNVLAVALGVEHTLFLTRSGVYVSGTNENGQLGLGDKETKTKPTLLPSSFYPGYVISVAVGVRHSMILTSEGLFAFGYNIHGQLGVGDFDDRVMPVRVPLPLDIVVKQVVCGYEHTVLLTHEGHVYVCGSNVYGQLGLRGENSGFHQKIGSNEDFNAFRKRIYLETQHRARSTFVKLDLPEITKVGCTNTCTFLLQKKENSRFLAFGGLREQEYSLVFQEVEQSDRYKNSDITQEIRYIDVPTTKILDFVCNENSVCIIGDTNLFAYGANIGNMIGLTKTAPFFYVALAMQFRLGYPSYIDLCEDDPRESESNKRPRYKSCVMCAKKATGIEPFHRYFQLCSNGCLTHFLSHQK